MHIKKIAFGLFIFLTALIAGDKFLYLAGNESGLFGSVPSLLIATAASLAGGFIAQRGMLLPVLGLWLAFWVYVIYVLHAIAVPTGAADLSATISANLVAISSSFVALCIGTVAGQALSRGRNNTSVAAT